MQHKISKTLRLQLLKGRKSTSNEKVHTVEEIDNVVPPILQTQKKEAYLKYYNDFWKEPGVKTELEAYARADVDFEYKILKGFVPKQLVGKVTTGKGPPWKGSDTFFTDFEAHYPSERILHATDKSLIICNHACHDVRLYKEDVDPTGTDKSLAAGMSYMHLLVIPVARVYNAVALEDDVCIEEMIAHFKTFWRLPDSKETIINAINGTMVRRYDEIVTAYKKPQANADPSNTKEAQSAPLEQRIKQLDDVMSKCRQYASECADRLRKMDGEFNGYMGFHPHPTTSVGHLHMHVLMKNKKFLTHSTRVHDHKNAPASVVLDVINEKNTSDKNPDTQSCSSFFHRFIVRRSSHIPAD
ncbi:hypothetical protein EYR36_002374 [Pleurotus pulmonarius]|nr:hypothetical protein EYR36_002374 [Pleurotus pulmonarius]